VFRTHGKIYEASASQMFGVPIEKIAKGNPEYALRQKGKVAELALGYQGSSGALIKMGALNMGLAEEELPDIVARWREANKRIRDLWQAMEAAAVQVVSAGGSVGVGRVVLSREYDHSSGLDYMTILLPSWRKLYYVSPTLGTNQWGKPSVTYMGMDQTTKRWGPVETYGGRLVENCLAEDSLVLTDAGWTPINQVSLKHRLWDGVEWVSHGGFISKGTRNTVSVNGVHMTPEHLVMAEMGWINASSCEGYNEHPVALPDSRMLRGIGREKIAMENSLRLRERSNHAGKRVLERQAQILRLYGEKIDSRSKTNTRDVGTPGLLGLALDERPLPIAHTSSLGKLWRTGHPCLCEMADRFYELLDRHGANLSKGPYAGSDRREWELLPGKLSLGGAQNSVQEQAQQCENTDALGGHDSIGGLGTVRNRRNNPSLSDSKRLVSSGFVCSSGRYEPVCDLLNAGPRNRFTVMGSNGPFIVHNCTQAIARDCLACAIERLEAAGYKIVMHCHDEVVIERPTETADLEAVVSIMSRPMPWGPELPLNADGWMSPYFKKE
jgi:hypothetical protein